MVRRGDHDDWPGEGIGDPIGDRISALPHDLARYESQLSPHRDTMRRDPRGTIQPQGGLSGQAYARALALLHRLRNTPGEQAATRFEVTDTLGIGGMGIVREATQVVLGRPVALKTLRPDQRSDDSTAALLREAWVTGSLNHPNVPPVHDITMDDSGAPLIVLERIDGQSWSDYMFSQRRVREHFGAEDLLEWNLGILMQVLNVVRFAHSRGIVHRDLKPDNVMIGEFGQVYVVDWGLAVTLRDSSGLIPSASVASDFAGTPAYMAPEMVGWRNLPIAETTDIYLIGAILYEILTGRPPHDADDPDNLIASVIRSKPALSKKIPRGLARICRRAMDPDPDGRFSNVEQVRLALQGFLQHRGSARLAMHSLSRLGELERELQAARPSDTEKRQELYRLYGGCRFGFQEALSNWPGNEAARDGMRRATEAMVAYELDSGDARAAAALCAGLDDPPEHLRLRIASAQQARAAERKRFESLEELAIQHDPRVGQHIRFALMLILGTFFTVAPPILWYGFGFDTVGGHQQLMIWTGGLLGLSLIIAIIAHETVTSSVLNRRLYFSLVIILTAQLVMELGLWRAHFSPQASVLMHQFMWFLALAGVAVNIEKRMIPSALCYLVVFIALAERPGWELAAFSLPHIGLTSNALIVWRPRS